MDAARPDERTTDLGNQPLSDRDLIAILLGSQDGESECEAAHDLAQRLLAKYRSLRTLARCEPAQMLEIENLSRERAVLLGAAFELGRRTAKETVVRMRVDSPRIVCQLFAQEMSVLRRESIRVILLDTKYQLIRVEEISLGSLNESIAHPREIFRPAIIHSAYAFILVHNHPSGDPTPSAADKRLTKRLVEVGEILQIELLDHIIIGEFRMNEPSYFSFKEAGAF